MDPVDDTEDPHREDQYRIKKRRGLNRNRDYSCDHKK